MADKNAYFVENQNATRRMERLVEPLTAKELTQKIGETWTISMTLTHLAFWDQRVIHVIEMAEKSRPILAPFFDNQINDILAPFLSAIPPKKAARMAIQIAKTLDQKLANCSPDFIEEMLAVNNRLVQRSLHRNDHLDEIEAVLGLTN